MDPARRKAGVLPLRLELSALDYGLLVQLAGHTNTTAASLARHLIERSLAAGMAQTEVDGESARSSHEP